MSRTFRCEHGHEWNEPERAGARPAPEDSPTCPICTEHLSIPPPPRAPLGAVQRLGQHFGVVPVDPPRRPAGAGGSLPHVPGFEVLGELGRGGMGVVYKARQTALNRLVALKMILAGDFAGAEQAARFRAEAEASARLQHPHIVQVYEVGQYEGRPYLALEYVDGGSLAQVLAGTPLPARRAAALVETLARAMHYAHERGIVHRDLKPANVLLQIADCRLQIGDRQSAIRNLQSAIPKITDFGLAKRLDEAGQTQSGSVLGTPSYMAPEQASGASRTAGPPADVYALGAVLYECLTGRPPFRAATAVETLALVRTQEPVPPSRFRPQLPRDVETICLKCLEKQPRRRYAGARDLADDLRRFLAGEPVRARPVGRPERAVKWCRRNPAWAALAAVCAVCLLTLVLSTAGHNLRLRAEVRRAEAGEALAAEERERARAGYREARETIRGMLSRLRERRVAEVPRLKELEEAQLQDSLAFFERRADDPDPEMRHDVAVALFEAGTIEGQLGRPGPAVEKLRRAAGLLETLAEEKPEVARYRDDLAVCCNNLGTLLDKQRPDVGEEWHRRALGLYEALVREAPDNPLWLGGVAGVRHSLGALCQTTGRREQARGHYAEAMALHERLVRERPGERRYAYAAAESHINLGLILHGAGDLPGAEASYRRAEQLLAPLAREHPEEPDAAISLAAVEVNWGNLAKDDDRKDEALGLYARAVGHADDVLAREPRLARARAASASAHGARAQLLLKLGSDAAAARDWDRVIELSETPRAGDRYGRALALARAGDFRRAADDVKILANVPGQPGADLFELACIEGLIVKAVLAPIDPLPPAERDRLAEAHGAAAVSLLRKAQDAGLFLQPGCVFRLKWDKDLNALRQRADFRELLSQVDKQK